MRRRQQYGENRLPSQRSRSILGAVREQLRSVLVLLLTVAAVVSWLTGDHIEAAAIAAVLVLNATIGFAMEWQAGRSLDALRSQTPQTARVRRAAIEETIAADDLVPGDIVLLAAGDRIPADLRILEAAALRVEEAPLTGESRSVFKSHHAVATDAAVAERSSMLFLGTEVTAGRAVAVVVATGDHTELGKIGRLISGMRSEPTPLQRKLEALGRRLAWVVSTIGLSVAVIGWLRGNSVWVMLETGISLAVAAVPEALPATTTFILARGVLRMARRNAIVRRLTAVETLGSTTVICSDKTGTLTQNVMTVTTIDARPEALRDLLRAVVLCNDATATSGDPTEIALVLEAVRQGIDPAALRELHPRTSEEPFDAQSKRMITTHASPHGTIAVMKGAPDVVLNACTIDPAEASEVRQVNSARAAEGLRVLAVAQHDGGSDDAGPGWRFLGLVTMHDPPRPGVVDAVREAREAGIRLVMITGDQVETAAAIARTIGWTGGAPVRVVHARELQRRDALDVVRDADVLARVSPEDKYRLVEALQQDGEIVAVTGDGVNDAPALRKADVGIAMGRRGTDVARQAANIVLTDDDFSTIVAAIESGRAIYANIIKFVHAMLSHNLSEVLTVFLAVLFGWPLPLLPLQILWINLVTDVVPSFALALEPPSPSIMKRAPRDPEQPILPASFLLLIAWQGVMLSCVALAAYAWALHRNISADHPRTIAMMSLVALQLGHMFNCRSRTRSAFDGLFSNRHLWYATGTVVLIQTALLSFAPFRALLRLTTLDGADALVIVSCCLLPIVIVDIQKRVSAGLRRRPAMPRVTRVTRRGA